MSGTPSVSITDRRQNHGSSVWTITSEICNLTDRAIAVTVTRHPYRSPDSKIGDRHQTHLFLAPGECRTLTQLLFEEPYKSYTDVWNYHRVNIGQKLAGTEVNFTLARRVDSRAAPESGPETQRQRDYVPPGGGGGGMVDAGPRRGTIRTAWPDAKTFGDRAKLCGSVRQLAPAIAMRTPYGVGDHLILIHTPFPWNIFDVFGPIRDIRFAITAIHGVPRGWTCECVAPKLDEPFAVDPYDRERQGVIRVRVAPSAQAGTVAHLHIVQRVVGAPDDEMYRINQYIDVLVLDAPEVNTVPAPVASRRAHDTPKGFVSAPSEASDHAPMDDRSGRAQATDEAQ